MLTFLGNIVNLGSTINEEIVQFCCIHKKSTPKGCFAGADDFDSMKLYCADDFDSMTL